MNLSADLHNISIAQAKELEQEIDQKSQVGDLLNSNSYLKEIKVNLDYDFTSNFSDGKSDGENNFEPIVYQWFNSDYRQGYLAGIARRIGVECAHIYGVKLNKVIFSNC